VEQVAQVVHQEQLAHQELQVAQVHQEQVDLQQLIIMLVLMLLLQQEQLERFKVMRVLDIMAQR
jgi:hypothetical protein